MKTKKKILVALALVGCAILLVAGSIAGTIAYLTATDTVTNTFTVGKVAIKLDEAKVTAYGEVDGTTRVKVNEYKLIPGHSYIKDPIVYVEKGSEESYVFIKVVNDLANIEAGETIATQIAENGWTALDGQTGVYYKVVDARETTVDMTLPVFASFTLKEDATVANYASATIVVTAYAIQMDQTGTAAEAWVTVSTAYANS